MIKVFLSEESVEAIQWLVKSERLDITNWGRLMHDKDKESFCMIDIYRKVVDRPDGFNQDKRYDLTKLSSELNSALSFHNDQNKEQLDSNQLYQIEAFESRSRKIYDRSKMNETEFESSWYYEIKGGIPWQILIVKRLRDNKMFSIGEDTSKGKITDFSINVGIDLAVMFKGANFPVALSEV